MLIEVSYLPQDRKLEIPCKFQTFANFIKIRKACSLQQNT